MNPNLTTEQDTQLLRQAFDSFAEVSNSLERAYQHLQGKVRHLSSELEKTNDYLESVLQSLPCGVIVIDDQQVVRTINHQACTLLGTGCQGNGPDPAQGLPAAPMSLRKLLSLLPEGKSVGKIFYEDPPPTEISLVKPARRILVCAFSRMKRGERVMVIQDVTELRDLQAQMQKSERSAAMGEMALEVAHEIRNPLTGLGLFANLLRSDDLSAQQRNRYLDHIEIGIQSLDTILTNMFSFSGLRQPRCRPVALHEIMREILRFMSPVIQERNIRVEESYSDRRKVEADPEMMRQAFMNLVLNALQALPEGGLVKASAERDPRGLRISLRDNGIGIPRHLQKNVFEPHFTTTEKGNGLGLSIVEKIVQAHGGRVSLRSRRGWGTEFRLAFPVAMPLQGDPASTGRLAAGGLQ